MAAMHESSSANPTRNRLPFMAPFDGEQAAISETDLSEVATRFGSLVEELHRTYEEDLRYIAGRTMLTLRRDEPDGSFWTAGIRSLKGVVTIPPGFRSSDRIIKQIILQRVEGDLGQESISYKISPDGIVRRSDLGDPHAGKDQNEALIPDTSNPLAGSPYHQLMSQHQIGMEVRHAVEDAGWNNQPIGTPEVQGLEEFMSQDGWEVWK